MARRQCERGQRRQALSDSPTRTRPWPTTPCRRVRISARSCVPREAQATGEQTQKMSDDSESRNPTRRSGGAGEGEGSTIRGHGKIGEGEEGGWGWGGWGRANAAPKPQQKNPGMWNAFLGDALLLVRCSLEQAPTAFVRASHWAKEDTAKLASNRPLRWGGGAGKRNSSNTAEDKRHRVEQSSRGKGRGEQGVVRRGGSGPARWCRRLRAWCARGRTWSAPALRRLLVRPSGCTAAGS